MPKILSTTNNTTMRRSKKTTPHSKRSKGRTMRKLARVFKSRVEHDTSSSSSHISKFIHAIGNYRDSTRNQEKLSIVDNFTTLTAEEVNEYVRESSSVSIKRYIMSLGTLLNEIDIDTDDTLEYLVSLTNVLSFPMEELVKFRTDLMNETVKLLNQNKGIVIGDITKKLRQPEHLAVQDENIELRAISEENEELEERPRRAEAPQQNSFDDLLSVFGTLRV